MELSAQKKKEIEEMLVETIITSLEKKELTADEYPKVSSFVLNAIKTVTTHDELIHFLKDLSSRWPIFAKIMVIQVGEARAKKDKETAQNVIKLAKSGRIEDATVLAKTVTEGT